MPVATVHVGTAAKVTFQPTAGSLVTLKNSEWSLKVDPGIAKSANTTDGIVRVAGLEDYQGSVKGEVDTTARIDAQVTQGTVGTIKLYVDETRFWQGTAILGPLDIEIGAEKLETWSFEYMKQSGALTKPV